MGVDIHLFVEVRTDTGGWRDITRPEDRPGSRNYALFGILADVRNYDRLKPIARRRGLPKDMSPEVGDYMTIGDDAADLERHSWVSLIELLAYPWPSELHGWWTDMLVRWHKEVDDDPALTVNDLRIVYAFDNV